MLLSGLSRGKPPGLPRERGAPSPAASQRGERQVPGLGPQPDEAGAEPEVQWSRAMWDQDPPVGIQGALPSGWGLGPVSEPVPWDSSAPPSGGGLADPDPVLVGIPLGQASLTAP